MEEVKDYKLHTKKVKFILGATAEETEKKAKDFEKDHNVINIMQRSEKHMIIFYWGEENESSN